MHQVLLTEKVIGNGPIGGQGGGKCEVDECGCNLAFFIWNFGVLLPESDEETKYKIQINGEKKRMYI